MEHHNADTLLAAVVDLTLERIQLRAQLAAAGRDLADAETRARHEDKPFRQTSLIKNEHDVSQEERRIFYNTFSNSDGDNFDAAIEGLQKAGFVVMRVSE